MTRYEQTSPEYLAMIADEENDAAFFAYIKAEGVAKKQWDAIPEGAAKDSAYENADEMMYVEKLIMERDRLGWLRSAIDTYNLNF